MAGVIETEYEYECALWLIEYLMEQEPAVGMFEGRTLDLMIGHVVAYEAVHYPIGRPTPEEAAAFRKEQEDGD